MIVELAVRVRVYPNVAQEELLAKTLGCKRWIWNYWLEERETYYKEHGNTIGFTYTSAKLLKETRPRWSMKEESTSFSLV